MLRFAPLCLFLGCGLVLDLEPPEEDAGGQSSTQDGAAQDISEDSPAGDANKDATDSGEVDALVRDSNVQRADVAPVDAQVTDAIAAHDANTADAPGRDTGQRDAGRRCDSPADCVGALGPCKEWACDGICLVANSDDTRSCDDGLFCTVGTTCREGVCGGGEAFPCIETGNACITNQCSEVMRGCVRSNVVGRPCVVPNGSGACRDGTCAVQSCSPAFMNCMNMCVDPQTDDEHCGGCGTNCSAEQSCVEGGCV